LLKRTYEGQNCSIARALELVGERWTLLIVRDTFLGVSRFDEFQESLGVAPNVLSDRLSRLVGEEILERRAYSDRPPRFEYRLTKKGRELAVPLIALMQWGDRHLSDKPPRVARRRADRSKVRAVLVGRGDQLVSPAEIEVVAGPGLAPSGDSRASERRVRQRRARRSPPTAS
jgi:DNA-binding HxlR family transcriptional regulator